MSTVKKSVIIIAIIVLALAVFIVTKHRWHSSRERADISEGTQARKSTRRITASGFAKRDSGSIPRTPREESDTEVPRVEEIPIPEEVPTAKSSDDEIREFIAWLSSLDRENTSDETEISDPGAEGNNADYDREKSLIESVIWEKWKKGYETYDIERYMSAIWEDDFFYTSDNGTPDDPSDDIIFRSGQQERKSAARVFSIYTKNIELNLSPRSDVEFLSDTIAMVKYDYELKVSKTPTPESPFEMIYSPGNMVIILEHRENPEGTSEWRILEWYDHARK